ncbi:ARMT1-like domain-containing protein [Amycolatopsis cihanbeyliensis]|uniref:Uncharacterized protein with ATP-grasp and redox domains n=1 Tax=Amycolatopsis cihanbeyliensis TaxID=1128664 RepID=A0A542CV08_AMYCI|nr:ARMT1-like domain-containing protein [Amycolatopsis cihanbeyliensis]TQI94658.1 uncharacterized protein with ATP-grasp and redox domains [Amycolatopsis cihanbeyliensis]
MCDARPPMLPPSQWVTVDAAGWREHRDTVLGRACEPGEAGSLLVGVPDSFTLAERLESRPRWLAPEERDGAVWLRDLVTRRLGARSRAASGTAAEHVHDQVRRVLELPDHDGRPVAETVWNQEAPYLIDRVAAWCLTGDPGHDLDPLPASIDRSRGVAMGLLTGLAARQQPTDSDELCRWALTAGLLDLGIKGGRAVCQPLTIPRGANWPARVAAALVVSAQRPRAVDHLAALHTTVGAGAAHLVLFTDDLIETAVDLLFLQHLLRRHPRLRVTVAPRSGRTDNDATHADVRLLLSHAALRDLAAAVDTGRVAVSPHGPATAAVLLDKLHPTVLRTLHDADAVVVKGGRNHELLTGTLDRPLWTGYVVAREFTEAQAGYDARPGPLMFVHAAPGQRPWWGWRGRAHRILPVAEDRVVPACWTTIADRHRREADPEAQRRDLALLLRCWPQLSQDYPDLARAEIRTLTQGLARTRLAPHDRHLLHQARLVTDPPGAPS